MSLKQCILVEALSACLVKVVYQEGGWVQTWGAVAKVDGIVLGSQLVEFRPNWQLISGFTGKLTFKKLFHVDGFVWVSRIIDLKLIIDPNTIISKITIIQQIK